jgi:hypothetical protein
MKLKLLSGATFLVVMSLTGAVVRAEIPIKDASEIAGTWKLESVAPALNKPRVEENRTWEFRTDGIIVTSGFNRHFNTEDRHEWKYQIVNGKIAADDPGRPGKTIDYAVYEKTGDTLILKGGIEGFYFFKKQ